MRVYVREIDAALMTGDIGASRKLVLRSERKGGRCCTSSGWHKERTPGDGFVDAFVGSRNFGR